MNGRLRSSSQHVGLRMRALAEIQREGRVANVGPGVECTGTPLGECLGIAAIFAGRGEQAAGVAVALLAIAGVADTPDHRARVLLSIDSIAGAVRLATTEAGHAH